MEGWDLVSAMVRSARVEYKGQVVHEFKNWRAIWQEVMTELEEKTDMWICDQIGVGPMRLRALPGGRWRFCADEHYDNWYEDYMEWYVRSPGERVYRGCPTPDY